MTEMLSQLGVAPTPARRTYLRNRLAALHIDTTHWRHSPRTLYSRAVLEHAVRASTSFAGVARVLGIPQAGGTQAHLARRIRREGIDTGHFLGQGHRRGAVDRRKTAAEVLVVHPTGSARPKTAVLRRVLSESGVAHRCDGCGAGPSWRGRPLTLVIDHANGDWLDNRLANLRFLCPNCHAQTSTWCRRKKGP
jgi:predicted RNA-binding Zn-ribbon protein involved in translation (DUF1610 family)